MKVMSEDSKAPTRTGRDAPIIIHDAKANAQRVICGQGVSPQAATLDRFAQLDLDLVPATGVLPAVVPGAFDAWCLLLRDWGTWELADVLAFAISYAKNGIHIVPRISAFFAQSEFRAGFEAKGRLNAYVAAIPTYVITRPLPVLLGAAALLLPEC